MIRSLIHSALIAGALVISGTTAFAQSQNMKTSVPFDFQVSGKTLPAGQYEIRRLAGEMAGWTMSNVESKQAVLLVSAHSVNPRPQAERAKGALVFRCAGESCALQSLYAPGAAAGHAFNNKPRNVDPTVQVATIRIVGAD